jgi:hypothetical protein
LNANLVFGLYNASGFAGWLIIAENPLTLNVVGTQFQHPDGEFGGGPCKVDGGPPCYTGYEFQGCSSFPSCSTTIEDATMNHYVIQPFYPSEGCSNLSTCIVGVWTGLSDASGGGESTGHLAQAGESSEIQNRCGWFGCSYSYTYKAFYEMLPNGPVDCSMGISPSDYLTSEVHFNGYSGGNYLYSFYVTDHSKNTECSATNQAYNAMTNPTWSDYIVEWPSFCSLYYGCDSLAQFTQTAMNGQLEFGGTNYGIYYPYSQGWYFSDTMQNYQNSCSSGNLFNNMNIAVQVNSQNNFQINWDSSQCT